MNEKHKIHTPYEYCDRVVDMLYDLEEEHPKLSDDLAIEIVKAAQLMRIADDLDAIKDTFDGGLDVYKQ